MIALMGKFFVAAQGAARLEVPNVYGKHRLLLVDLVDQRAVAGVSLRWVAIGQISKRHKGESLGLICLGKDGGRLSYQRAPTQRHRS
jgi:hypothetical protein